MDNFKKKFLEEAAEHIEDLEQSLLELEQAPDNIELIEKVFRAMHSLKGGGAMFGFDEVSNFTHDLETMYDLLRNDKIKLSKEMLDVTLASVDHLKILLDPSSEGNDQVKEEHDDLLKQINAVVVGETGLDKTQQASSEDTTKTNEEEASATFYYILFQPKEDIFDNGTNPLYLVDELASMGKCKAFPHYNRIPEFKKLDPSKCYVYWELLLHTTEDVNAINDVFIFVEDDCVIEINQLSHENLFEREGFVAKAEESIAAGKATIINDLRQFLTESVSKTPVKKEEKEVSSSKLKKVLGTKDNQISSIRVASDKLDQLMNLVSELVTTQARLSLYAEESEDSELVVIAENVQKLTRQLRDNAFSIVLIPIENMLTRFQRLVRDLSKELKKDVVFDASGTDTELDKTIIENLTDPMMHILRNSLDHGIESPEERKKAGKPEQGHILLKAYYSGANVHIQVIDDGRGLDVDKIRQKAISKNLISADANISEKEIYELILLPGFSTAENVTDVSGRGVGMDVVKRKIADIRGEVEIESTKGVGTTLTIKLPLTLSIIDGLLVKVSENYYVIPLSAVDKIYAVKPEELKAQYNNLIVLDGVQIPFYHLGDEFEEDKNERDTEEIVVVSFEDKRVGFVVDTVVGEYQAVLKPLGKHYKNQDIISGATILGDGTVALVMDSNKAVKHFAKIQSIKED